MRTVISADSTAIAYDELGDGPPIILIGGAFNDRRTTAPLAAALSDGFTVLNADRRGRGDSGDHAEYAVQREVEDLDALIAATGGSAAVFGYSSGAMLVLEAAAAGSSITRLALYEPPFIVDASRRAPAADLAERVRTLVADDRRGDAVELFQLEAVGLPEEVVVRMRHAPFRPGLEAIAQTLAYEAELTGDASLPADLAAAVTAPTLVLAGAESPAFFHTGAAALVDALPAGRLQTLPGQTHDLDPEPTAAAIAAFLAG